MGIGLALRVAVALAVPAASGIPWHGLEYFRRDVTPSLPATNSTETPTATTPASSDDSYSTEVYTTISATNSDCSGTVSYDGSPPPIETITVTQSITVGPSETIPPADFITPLQPCQTIVKPEAPCPYPCSQPPVAPVLSSIVQITKKTNVYEAPEETDPPSFDDDPATPPPEPQTTADNPSDPQDDIDRIINNILHNAHEDSPGGKSPGDSEGSGGSGDPDDPEDPDNPENPSAAPPEGSPAPSTVTCPPEVKSTISLADIPITVFDQSIVAIGDHTVTFTHNSNANTGVDNVLGPTTTFDVSSVPITVAAPVIIGPSTTFVVNPSLLNLSISPSSSSGPAQTTGSGNSGGQGADGSSTNGEGQTKPTATVSSSEGSAHRRLGGLHHSPNLETLGFTAATLLVMAGVWVLI